MASALRQLRAFIRNVLLHELVHFVNNELEREERDAKGNPIEAGEEFDRDARWLKDPLSPFFLTPQKMEDTPLYLPPRDSTDPLFKILYP